MKTRALVEDVATLIQKYSVDSAPALISQGEQRFKEFESDGRSVFRSSKSAPKLAGDKLERVASKIVARLGDSVPQTKRNAFIAGAFPALHAPIQRADKAHKFEKDADAATASLLENAAQRAEQLIDKAESQADAAIKARIQSGSAMLNQALAEIQAKLDATLSQLADTHKELAGAQGELAEVKAGKEEYEAAWNAVDQSIEKRFANVPDSVQFTAGGAHFYVNKQRLQDFPSVLSGLASGKFVEYHEPAEGEQAQPISVSDITEKELSVLCRFIDDDKLPRLTADNAPKLFELADRFCVVGLRAHIEEFMTNAKAVPAVGDPKLTPGEQAMISGTKRMFSTKLTTEKLLSAAAAVVAGDTDKAAIPADTLNKSAVTVSADRNGYTYGLQIGMADFENADFQQSIEAAWFIVSERLKDAGCPEAKLTITASYRVALFETATIILGAKQE